jgi:predicted enzyme related to lactoylglutathione lyase
MKFYNAIIDGEMQNAPMPGMKYGVFPYDEKDGRVGGGIVEMEGYVPSDNGVVIYINGGDDLSHQLARVEPAGGKIIMPKTNIGENGFMALFLDTEGNRIAFHSEN